MKSRSWVLYIVRSALFSTHHFFNGSADLHTPIHHPLIKNLYLQKHLNKAVEFTANTVNNSKQLTEISAYKWNIEYLPWK